MSVNANSWRAARVLITAGALLATLGCYYVSRPIVMPIVRHTEQGKKVFTPPKADYTVTGSAWTNSIGEGTNTITVLHFVGVSNYYSFGYYHGRLFASQIRGNVDTVYGIAKRLLARKKGFGHLPDGTKQAIIDVVLDEAWKMMEPYVYQSEKDEMQGLVAGLRAGGVKISLKEVHRLVAIPDLTETTCSAFIATGSATKDGHTYQLRVLDYGAGSGLERYPLITVYCGTRPGENSFVNVGWIGFIGLVSGMNDQKVAISEMGMGTQPNETLCGEPMIMLLKRVLRNANSAEAATSIIRSAQRNNAYAYGIGDGKGGAFGLLTSARSCQVYPVNADAVINYGQMTLPQFKDIMYAGYDSKKLCELADGMKGKIDLESIQQLARTVRLPSCLHVVIYQNDTGDIWIANRHGNIPAADCQYVKFPFSMWGAEAQRFETTKGR
jgi:hypothetical protein